MSRWPTIISALSSFARMPVPNWPVRPRVAGARVLEINPPGDDVEFARFARWASHVLGDGDQLRIALGNLIRNARDAMPEGGRLTLRGYVVDGAVEVSVIDTGLGIEAKDLARIMEPLFSTKARASGWGLQSRDRSSTRIRVASAWSASRGAAAHSRSDWLHQDHPATEPPHDRPQRSRSSSWTTTRTSAAT